MREENWREKERERDRERAAMPVHKGNSTIKMLHIHRDTGQTGREEVLF